MCVCVCVYVPTTLALVGVERVCLVCMHVCMHTVEWVKIITLHDKGLLDSYIILWKIAYVIEPSSGRTETLYPPGAWSFS